MTAVQPTCPPSNKTMPSMNAKFGAAAAQRGGVSRSARTLRIQDQGGGVMRQFQEAARSLTSVLAPVEKRVLVWMAARLPRWVNSDHLTGLALAAMLLAGLSYWLARVTSAGLLA